MPDGHMSALWDNATARWLTFYPNHESFRWEGGGRVWPLLTSADLRPRTSSAESPLPEAAEVLDPGGRVTGGLVYGDQYNNGGECLQYKYLNIYTQYLNIYTGEWLYAVFPTSRAAPARLTGFVHAEDHYWTQVCV